VRLSREIDKRARIVFFVDYVISVITISAMPKDQAASGTPRASCQSSYLPDLAPKQCRPVCNHRIANKTMNHVCTQAGVLTLNMYGYFNALAIMAAVLIWARVLHMRLQHALIYDPLTVFHNSTEDMDANEVTGLPCCLTNLCHLDYLIYYHAKA